MVTSAQFWDKAAAKYAKSPIKDMASYEATLERTRAYLTETSEVLEVGCGTGTTALKLAPCVKHITATDISPNMIAIARGKAESEGIQNVTFSSAMAGDHTGGGARYDAIMAFNMLHLVSDVPGTIKSLKAQLKPGGYFISKTVCLGKHGWHWRVLVGLLKLIGKAPDVTFFSASELEALIKDAGFEILETGDYPKSPPSHFIVGKVAYDGEG